MLAAYELRALKGILLAPAVALFTGVQQGLSMNFWGMLARSQVVTASVVLEQCGCKEATTSMTVSWSSFM